MTTRYQQGYAFENRVKADIQRHGYYAVRSGGSKGIVDILAVREHSPRILMVQCKRKGAISREEWNELLRSAELYGGHALMAYMPGARGIEYRGLVTERAHGDSVEACSVKWEWNPK